ncbi:MAG: phosphoribosylglycinamide formyltransferase [Ignavibacteriaceae bacterium]|nr:phosphoribosylglycinamide formyltransferase [Ignavibacteriaceae bacterium]
MNLAVFVSGRGSNLKAILENEELSKKITVKVIFSDKIDCGAFTMASQYQIPKYSISAVEKNGYISFAQVKSILSEKKIDLIVLAGYLKLIPAEIISDFQNKIINIHPALLPLFGGKGMYGMNVHKACYDSGMKVSGATVHFVDNTFDTGKIIFQKCTDISNVDGPEEIAKRVLHIEHEILPFVISKIADQKLKFEDDRIIIQN